MARPRKARVEGEERHESVFTASQLGEIVGEFKARFPDEWESLRLGPCQYGIEQMIEALNR